MWLRRLRTWFALPGASSRRPRQCRLRLALETLEDRLAPSGSGIQGTSAISSNDQFTYQIMPRPPVFTNPASTVFTVNQSGTFTFLISALPTAHQSQTAGTLPNNTTLMDKGGRFSGNRHVCHHRHPAPAAITSARSATFVVGQAGTFTVTTRGFPFPTLSETGVLPAGIIFVDNHNGTATLGGIPKADTGMIYAIAISAGNGIIQKFRLRVEQPPIFTSADAVNLRDRVGGRLGAPPYFEPFVVTTAGFPTATIGISGTLPAGVTFVNNRDGTATLHAVPRPGSLKSTYSFTLVASDGVLPEVLQEITLTVTLFLAG